MTPTISRFARATRTIWVRSLMIIALTLSGMLLLSNLPSVPDKLHRYLSSLPLAMAGIGYAILQLHAGPRREILLKRLLIAATFVLWAVDQLVPAGRVATLIGDVVIAAYVLDLFWLSQEQASAIGSSSETE